MENVHTTILLGNFDSIFHWQLVSKGMWSARSPDFSPADFFLWGFLTKAVYSNHPHTLELLQVYSRHHNMGHLKKCSITLFFLYSYVQIKWPMQ
jgi:hypothetical protein